MAHCVTVHLLGDRAVNIAISRLIIAGFTGRNPRSHIEELRRFGVEPPPSVPVFYDLDPRWLTVEDVVTLPSPWCSGEVEPVLLFRSERIDDAIVTVGSDFTDREIERQSIVRAKEAPKPVSPSTWPYPEVAAVWDRLSLKSWVDDNPEPYQAGVLGEFLPAETIVERLRQEVGGDLRGTALFMGTLTLNTDGFRYGGRFSCELARPDGMALRLTVSQQRPRTTDH